MPLLTRVFGGQEESKQERGQAGLLPEKEQAQHRAKPQATDRLQGEEQKRSKVQRVECKTKHELVLHNSSKGKNVVGSQVRKAKPSSLQDGPVHHRKRMPGPWQIG